MAMADEDRRTSTKGTDLAATPHPQNCEFWQHPGGGGVDRDPGCCGVDLVNGWVPLCATSPCDMQLPSSREIVL